MKTKLLLVDDHKIMREGLKALLMSQKGIEIVGEADDGMEAVKLAGKLKPGLVVMDLSLPNLNGIDATRKILEQDPGIKVLALSMHSDKRFVSRALREGASGYVLKDCAASELLDAIETVMKGRVYLSPQIANIVINDYKRQLIEKEYSVDTVLSKREREVLQLFAEGKSTKDIAHLLNLSIKTIETHRSQIMIKLEINNIAGLTKFAIREGLTHLE
ncbi:MAG: response regulator transcription factor [Thermodesulfovibrionales bacterium]|nr:response regulator transcription factor [Thermodesulfovibrionales bacterium]